MEELYILEELKYNKEKKQEYFEEMKLKKVQSWNAIGIAFLTIISLTIIFS